MVGFLARSRLFFHHFFQGSIPKFEFRPKMRIRRAWGRRGGGRGRGLSKSPLGLSKTPPCSHGAPGPQKGPKTPPWGQGGAPLGLGPMALMWSLLGAYGALCGPCVGPMWAPWTLCGHYGTLRRPRLRSALRSTLRSSLRFRKLCEERTYTCRHG